MFLIVVGGGKVGANLMRELLALGHEVVLLEQDRARFARLEEAFGHSVIYGDGTELYVLERAGVKRPAEIVVAATGDDEDNIVICQLAREKYGVPKVIARVNDPRNEQHFELLNIGPIVSPTRTIMALIEHEVPEHELVHLLQLRKENLEIVEVEIDARAPAVGRRVEDLPVPPGIRLISVMREGAAEIAVGATKLQAGDQVLAILEPGKEAELRQLLLAPDRRPSLAGRRGRSGG